MKTVAAKRIYKFTINMGYHRNTLLIVQILVFVLVVTWTLDASVSCSFKNQILQRKCGVYLTPHQPATSGGWIRHRVGTEVAGI